MSFFEKIIWGLRLFRRAFGGYKWQIIILTVIGFLSGLLEGIGANALIPLFSFIMGGEGGSDFISKTIEFLFGFVGIDFSITHLLIFIAVIFILKAAVLFVGSYVQFKISYDYEKKTRMELFQKVLQSTWPYLLKQKIGHLEKVLSSEIQMVARLLRTLSSFILIITGLFVYIIVALNISISITLVTLFFGVLTLFVFQPLVKKIRELSLEFSRASRDIAHFVNENIIGMKVVKAMSVTSPVFTLGEGHFELLRKLEMKRSLLATIFGSLFQPFSIIFILLLFSFSYKTGNFNLPAFVAIVYLIQRIFSYVQNLQTHVQTVFSSIPYLEHVLLYQQRMLKNEEEDSGKLPFQFNHSLAFCNVFFEYKKDIPVLADVTFQINKTSFIGLVGDSGSGKTTVVDLMLRLFEPNSGSIFLDSISIKNIDLHEYRKKVGYVSQDIYLINDTIANNIRFFDDSITDKQIIHATKQAYMYDVIKSLPDKFNSIVGERGVRLSMGQRQRIVIARVLARNPQLLILDEATSALDNESEKRIQGVIENLKGKITVFVIAHRLETVMNCDKLIVLRGGKIVEEGVPQDLLKNKESYFFKMYNIRK